MICSIAAKCDVLCLCYLSLEKQYRFENASGAMSLKSYKIVGQVKDGVLSNPKR